MSNLHLYGRRLKVVAFVDWHCWAIGFECYPWQIHRSGDPLGVWRELRILCGPLVFALGWREPWFA
ncbi:MAG TPA: hypothetical protein VN878_05905 [Usitatibacter sp.]|nr:hypothetical protein [Usitatibacter sp.]